MEQSYYDKAHDRRREIRVRRVRTILFLFFCISALLIAGKRLNLFNYGNNPSLWMDSVTNTVSPQEGEAYTRINAITVDITAKNACVMSIDLGSVIYQKNSDAHIAPASTAKMLTALTVIDYYTLDDLVTVGSEIDMVARDSSIAWLNHGDTLTVKQLLVALLLPSGNDAAYALAINTGRRIAGDDSLSDQQAAQMFVDAMNRKAKELGAASSNFVCPDGYDADGQYSTANDLALIAKSCLNNDDLAEIMGSHRISDTWASGRDVTYYNTNELLNPDSPYYYSNAIGLKTGNSSSAGSCLVSAASINGQIFVCVVMGSTEEQRFSDSLSIYEELEKLIYS